MLRTDFLTLLEKYQPESREFMTLLADRKKKKENNEIDEDSMLTKSGLLTVNILEKTLPEKIRTMASLRTDLKIKGSSGAGNMAEIPHICILDKEITNSAQRGYYIVYLINTQTQKVYLSLNQGFTEYRNAYGQKDGTRRIRENASRIQRLLGTVKGFSFGKLDWGRTRSLGQGYDNGNICFKEYDKNNLPDDAQLIDDLRNLIGIYRDLKRQVGLTVFDIKNISEAEYQDEVQASSGIELPSGPKEKKSNVKPVSNNSSSFKRDPNVAAEALKRASYSCENDPTHTTFITSFGHQFMEAHHLIPMGAYDNFEFDIDVPENVICLCPNCHRAFHHSKMEVRAKLIEKFLTLRLSKIGSRGISIDFFSLKQLYQFEKV
jgi:5-methylcytosine-specific restriction protein A